MKVNKILRQRKVQVFSFLSLALFAYFNFSYMSLNNHQGVYQSLNEGLYTCQGRLQQSYAAKVLGGKSPYLSSTFVANTKSCYEELIRLVEQSSVLSASQLEETVQLLVAGVREVQGLLSPETNVQQTPTPRTVILSRLSSEYQKVENTFDEFYSQMSRSRANWMNQKETLEVLTWTFFLLSILSVFLLIYQLQNFFNLRSEIEENASQMLKSSNKSKSKPKQREVVETFLSAFELLRLNELKQLFLDFSQIKTSPAQKHMEAIGDHQNTVENKVKDQPVFQSTETDLSEIQAPVAAHGFLLEETLTEVIDHCSSEIFKAGVKINIECVDGPYIAGSQECIFESIYYALIFAVKSAEKTPKKRVTLSVRSLGGVVLLEVITESHRFSEQFMIDTAKKRLKSSDFRENKDLELAYELIKGEGKIAFENVSSDEGNERSSKIQFILSSIKTSKKPLREEQNLSKRVSVKKGRKRDILEMM